MKRHLVATLGLLAAGTLGLFIALFWREALELWHISRLDSGNASGACAAAEALVGLHSARAVPVLLRFEAADGSRPLAQHARRILAALDDDGYEQLAVRLSTGPDELAFECYQAARAAGVERPRLLGLLRRALASSSVRLRRWACEEAGEVGAAAASLLPEIRAAQESSDRLVRVWARIAAAKIDPDAPAIALLESAGDR